MVSQVERYYPSTRRAVGPVSQTDRFYDDTRNDVRCPYAEGLEDMSGHLRRRDNPHGVTAEQTGAVPLLGAGEHAEAASHGKTALVTQNGDQGGFAVSGQAGADPEDDAYVTRYQRDAITAFGANETEVERYLIGPQNRNQPKSILRIGDLAATKPVTVTPESVGYVQKVTLALQIDRETLAHAAAADSIDWVPSSKAVQAALDQKADATHTHTTAQVTGLDTELAGKANAADLTAEATARAQADTAHTNALAAEATARQQGDADTLADAKAYADGKVTGVYHYKGSVASRSALPAAPAVGDVYNVQDEDGQNVAWTGSAWDALGATVDLSAYDTAQTTQGKITAAVAPKANSADVYPKAQTYTKTEVDTLVAQAVATAKAELLEQLKTLYAPLSSVQATVDGTTYRWAWDDTFQTFAMQAVEEA